MSRVSLDGALPTPSAVEGLWRTLAELDVALLQIERGLASCDRAIRSAQTEWLRAYV